MGLLGLFSRNKPKITGANQSTTRQAGRGDVMQWGCSILRQCSPLWIHARSLLENVGYWVHENSNFMISRSFANAIIANAFLKGERCLNYWKSTVLSLGALYTAVRTLCIFLQRTSLKKKWEGFGYAMLTLLLLWIVEFLKS